MQALARAPCRAPLYVACSSADRPRSKDALSRAPPSTTANGRSLGSSSSGRPNGRVELAYSTSWREPQLHHSWQGGEWRTAPLQQVPSGGGAWTHIALPQNGAAAGGAGAAGADAPPLLEFVLTDGGDAWDKPISGENYVISQPGRYRLAGGTLEAVRSPAVLLVTDLDDTLVGDDEATAAFAGWWRGWGLAAGGRLVYNTGRALSLFEELLAEKEGILPEPDVLIASVGTKVYRRSGRGWDEDSGYAARLSAGWELEAVREACYAALAAAGREAMHFRPPSEMNEHKVTCGVRADVLEQVLGSVTARLGAQRVAHRAIVSGRGDWRFVDLVPRAAGKLQALQYVQRQLGFDDHSTVACGDSGNDRDMLEGGHLSVVVGNAQPDLMAWARERRAAVAAGAGRAPLVVGPHRAHGILEGLRQLGFRE